MYKRLIAAYVLCIMLLSSSYVFAQGEVLEDYHVPELPGTYVREGLTLMGEDDFESILVEGWKNCQERINLGDAKVPRGEFDEKYNKAFYHNPIYYYVSGACRLVTSNGYVIAIKPEYTETNRTVIDAYMAELQREVDEILLNVSGHMTDFEKVMAVHDCIVMDYEYDQSLSNRNISILTTKTGVCMSYTFVFQHLMNLLGIECTYVSSDPMNHVWNLVKVDGEWYHLDATYDDPTRDRFAMVSHEHALISTNAIQKQKSPHYGFNTGKLKADSTLYDKAPWRENNNAFAYAGGKSYWFVGDDLKDEDGKVIYADIVKDGKWIFKKEGNRVYFLEGNFSGLAAYNDYLYFNSDSAIYQYDTKTQKTEVLKQVEGVCGLYIENNTLHYNKYDNGGFVKADSILLGDLRESEAWVEDGMVITRIYNETDVDWMIFSASDAGVMHEDVKGKGVHTIALPAEGQTKIFLWDKNMKPIQQVLDVE